MSRRPDFLKKYETHPNRVQLKDLKPGDFFCIIDHDDWSRQHGYGSAEVIWRCAAVPKVTDHYRNSLFCLTTSMNREKVGLQTTCIYNWFGQDPILIKLPKKQQTIYRHLFNAIDKNDEVHELGWSDWARQVHHDEHLAEVARRKKEAVKELYDTRYRTAMTWAHVALQVNSDGIFPDKYKGVAHFSRHHLSFEGSISQDDLEKMCEQSRKEGVVWLYQNCGELRCGVTATLGVEGHKDTCICNQCREKRNAKD